MPQIEGKDTRTADREAIKLNKYQVQGYINTG